MSTQSEVARLMQQIELETQAMQRAMTGFATVGKHEIIMHRYEAIGRCRDQLATIVGDEQATGLMIQSYTHVLEGSPDGTTRTQQNP